MTFLQIINLIKETALAQPNVNTFVRNFLDLNREDTVYSAVVLQDRDGLRDRISEQDWNTYTFHLGYVDRLTFDESNRDDIFSTGINIINNIVASIRDTWFPDIEVNIIDRFQTFDQRFTASCAGVYVVLSIQVPVSDCVDGEQTDLYDKYETKITENGHYHFVPDGRPVDEINITIDVPGGGEKPEESLVETISSNGDYHYDPSAGSVFSDVSIAVDVHPSTSLSETYTSNGTYNVSGEFKDGVVTVSVPSDMKPETICDKIIEENGSFHYYPESGEVFNDVHITTNVHPSESLVRSITDNSSYHYDGEWSGADITVDVHPSVSLSETYTENGIYNISGEFNGGLVTVSVSGGGQKPEERLVETIRSNGNYNYDPSDGSVFSEADITVDVHPTDKLVETITSNGTKSFSGEWKDAAITVAIPSDQKPEESLEKTITSNGSFHYDPSAGSVFSNADITVDVHPTAKLSKTYTKNGTYNVSGEWKDAAIKVNVPSTSTVTMTQAQYNALSVKDSNTIYLIKG